MDQKIIIKSNNEVPPNVYEKITVIVKGKQLPARPIDFLFNDDKLPYEVTKWETTDPNTGQLLQFSANEITWQDGKAYFGEQHKLTKPDSIVVLAPRQRIRVSALPNIGQVKAEEQVKEQVVVCPFRDPIEEGLFSIE